jgi:hypothetical protein
LRPRRVSTRTRSGNLRDGLEVGREAGDAELAPDAEIPEPLGLRHADVIGLAGDAA